MLLSSTYFGPVQWYSKLCHSTGPCIMIEAHETFVKQTYRNRCVIATANGPQSLTVPVTHGNNSTTDISGLLISDHGNWRHLHWQALQTAYGESAFFEYYEDDLRPFFTERRWERLIDFNMDITRTMCRLLDIDVNLQLTSDFAAPATPAATDDWRYAIRPKNPMPDPSFTPRPYYQVYRERHGFLPNLSVLDLLFNEGPQAILYLVPSQPPPGGRG